MGGFDSSGFEARDKALRRIKKSISGVSQKGLTAQLRAMEDRGLLVRTVYPEVPPRVEYTLTALGRSLKPILDVMQNWGEAYKRQYESGELPDNDAS